MNINAVSFAGYKAPVVHRTKEEDCTSLVVEGYGLKDFVQIDCYEGGAVVKYSGRPQTILAKIPKIQGMMNISPPANLTDEECKASIAKYCATA